MRFVLELLVPSVIVFTTLFGLLARGNPRPGGVALFWRVGLVGVALGVVGLFAGSKLFEAPPSLAVNASWGFVGVGVLAVALAMFGSILKRK